MARRLSYVALGIGLALLAALALAFAVSRGLAREQLRGKVEAFASEAVGEPVTIGAIEGPLLPGVVVRDLVVGAPESPWLAVRRIALRIEPGALLRGVLVIERLEIEGPRLALRRSRQGAWNAATLRSDGTSEDSLEAVPPSVAVRITELMLRDGEARVGIDDEGLPIQLETRFDASAEEVVLPMGGAGIPSAARASLRLTETSGRVGTQAIDAGTAALSLAGSALDAEMAARAPGSHFFTMVLHAEADATTARVDARTTLDGDELTHLTLRAPREAIGRGLRVSDPFFATLRSRRLDLTLLNPLLPADIRIGAGVASADLQLDGGRPLKIRGRADASGVGATLPGVGSALSPMSGSVVLAPDERGVRVDSLQLETALGSVAGTGAVGVETLHDVALEISGLDPARLMEVLGVRELDVGGEATAQLSLDGAFGRPSVEGRIDWAPARIGTLEVHRATVTLTSDATHARAEAVVIASARRVLSGWAEADLPEVLSDFDPLGPGVRAEVRGDALDVSALQRFLPRQLRALRGSADLHVTFEGGDGGPGLDGSLELAEGSLSVPALAATWAPIEARLVFDDRELVLESLRVAGAAATAHGSVTLQDLRPRQAHLAVAFRSFPLARSPLLTADLSGDLRLDGPVDALVLTGELAPERARLRIPEPDDPVLREIEVISADAARTPTEERPPASPGAFERASADVLATVSRNTWLRGRGLDLELEGDLRIRKQPLGPVRLAGDVRAVRGRYRFQGKRFDLRRGVVTFDGADTLDPILDLEADHRVRSVIVKLRLEGRASDPVLTLWSEPEMSEEDVLSYLFFGRPANEAPSGTDFGSAAARFATGVAVSQASEILETELPFDSIDIRIGEDGKPEELGVGSYVSDDLFVGYGRTFGAAPVDRMSIELRLDEHWSVESEMATDRNAGADLIWSYDF